MLEEVVDTYLNVNVESARIAALHATTVNY